MQRWNETQGTVVENKKIDAYLAEIEEVSRRHGLSISHEDGHGAFVIGAFDEGHNHWLWSAHDDTPPAKKKAKRAKSAR